MLAQLAGLLDPVRPADSFESLSLPTKKVSGEAQVAETLAQVLDPSRLAPENRDDANAVWQADKLSLVLGCAPGLAGVTQDGTFSRNVLLTRHSPHMEFDTWPLLCLGPEETA